MSVTVVTNLSDNEFILHKLVLEPLSTLSIDDSVLSGATADWEVLRPLNYLASAGDVTTSGAVTLPNWNDYPGGISDPGPVDFSRIRHARFFRFR